MLEDLKKAKEIVDYYGENNREFIDTILTTLVATKKGRLVLLEIDAALENSYQDAFDGIEDVCE